MKKVVDVTYRPKRSPLHYAVLSNQVDIAEMLIQNGARIDAIDELDNTPLFYAVRHEHLKLVDLMLSHSANPCLSLNVRLRKTVYRLACETNSRILECFLDHGWNVNEEFRICYGIKVFNECTYSCCSNWTALNIAIRHSKVDSVNLLIARGANVNWKNDFEETSLHIACFENNLEIVNILLAHGALIYVSAVESLTPLHIAVRKGSIKIVEALLNASANTQYKDLDSKTAIELAVDLRHTQIVDCILARSTGVDCMSNRSAFKAAFLSNGLDSEICKKFIDRGFEFTPTEINEMAFYAAANGRFHVIETFIKRLRVNDLTEAKDRSGQTLLHIATKKRRDDIMRLLIDNGTDIHTLDDEDNAPIHLAIENNDISGVEIYMREAAKTGQGFPLLLHSVLNKSQSVNSMLVELILEHDPDAVNQPDYDFQGCTALHLVCHDFTSGDGELDCEIAQLLLRKGANVNATTFEGSTPLHMAATHSKGVALVKMLLCFEPNIDACDSQGNTPLHLACSNACGSTVKLLLNAGAKFDQKNDLGVQPMELAMSLLKNLPDIPPEMHTTETLDYERSARKAIKWLKRHVIKLNLAGIKFRNIVDFEINSSDMAYYAECEKELKELRCWRINNIITGDDVLCCRKKKIVKHMHRSTAEKMIEDLDFKRFFPIYCSILERSKMIIMREYFEDSAKPAIAALNGIGLPEPCTENIVQYLDCCDMSNLVIAVSLCKIP